MTAATASAAGLHFIVATEFSNSTPKTRDPDTRRLIRRHVMQGKNKIKPHPVRQPKEVKLMVDPGRGPQELTLDMLVETCCSFIPRKVGSDFSFTNFAEEISPATFGDITHFFGNVMKYMFPLGEFIGFQGKDRTGFELLATDASFLHVTAFSAGAFIDLSLRQRSSQEVYETRQESMLHFLKGIRLLREKLLRQDKEETLSDGTVSVILTLVNCSYGTGDYETARQHLEGLQNIVKLRGGFSSLKGQFGKKLFMEMLRCDIGIALHTNSAPILFRVPDMEPFPPYPDQKRWVVGKSPDNADKAYLSNMNGELAAAWLVMQKFCSLVSLAMETQRVFSMEIVLDTMASVMYRLLAMDFEIGSVDEAMRLGLLAFCYSVFLRWQGMTLPSSHFPTDFKSSIVNLRLRRGFHERAMLWLLMVGGISGFSDSEDQWLKDCLQEHLVTCHITSWDEVRKSLKSFIWISPLHDKPGRDVFESLRWI